MDFGRLGDLSSMLMGVFWNAVVSYVLQRFPLRRIAIVSWVYTGFCLWCLFGILSRGLLTRVFRDSWRRFAPTSILSEGEVDAMGIVLIAHVLRESSLNGNSQCALLDLRHSLHPFLV